MGHFAIGGGSVPDNRSTQSTVATLVILLSCLALPNALEGGPAPSKPKKTAATPRALSQRPAAEMLGSLPLVFEPNLGQTDARVRFLTRASGMTAFLTDHDSVIVLSRHRETSEANDPDKTPEIEQTVVGMKLDGAKAPRSFEGLEKLESISNYFIGNMPSKWVTNVPNYRKARATGVYPGIDLVYYGDGRKLEYDFVVR